LFTWVTLDDFSVADMPSKPLTRIHIHLPALWILPIEIESVEIVPFQKTHHVLDKLVSGGRVVDQLAVLAAGRIVPTADGQQHLNAELLERRHLPVKICKHA